MLKIHLPTLFLLLILFNISLSHSDNKNSSLSLSHNPLKILASNCDQLKRIFVQYPDISESLSKIAVLSEENSRNLWETHLIIHKLLITLDSALNKYLEIDPTEHENSIQEQIKDLDSVITNIGSSYLKTKEEIDKIPFGQLYNGAGKAYDELSLEIEHLREETITCSTQHRMLLDEFDRVNLQHQAGIQEIQEYEREIQFRKNILEKNNARLKELEQESEEALKQFEAEIKEIKDGYEADFLEKKKAALDSSEQKVKMMDESLLNFEMKAAELRSAQPENHENLLQEINVEMAKVRIQKANELLERHKTLQALQQFYDERKASVQEESVLKKKNGDLLQDLQGKRNPLFKANDEIQLLISDLRSRKSKIPIFPSKLEDLSQRSAHQKQECDNLQAKRSKKIEERDALPQDENLGVGVFKQRELIRESEKFGDSKENLIRFMDEFLSNLKLKNFHLESSLKTFSMKPLRENIESRADLHLGDIYGRPKDSCKEIVDCLQEILTDKFSKKKFDIQLPLPLLLSVTLLETKNVSSILKGEDITISQETEDLLRAKLLSYKESKWTLFSVLQSFLKNVFGSDLFHFVKVGEEEFQNEKKQAQAILNLSSRDVAKEFERLILNRWKANLEEIRKNFVNILLTADNFAALS